MCIAFLRSSFGKIRHRKLFLFTCLPAGILSVHNDMARVSEHVASTATILSALLFIDVDVFITYSVVSFFCIEMNVYAMGISF